MFLPAGLVTLSSAFCIHPLSSTREITYTRDLTKFRKRSAQVPLII